MSYTLFTGLILSQQQSTNRKYIMSNLPTPLNKSQQNELAKIISYSAALGDDYMARGLSAMYRSARKTSQQDAILGVAMAFKVVSNPEFIVGNRCAYI
jgi:hypothetical protein